MFKLESKLDDPLFRFGNHFSIVYINNLKKNRLCQVIFLKNRKRGFSK